MFLVMQRSWDWDSDCWDVVYYTTPVYVAKELYDAVEFIEQQCKAGVKVPEKNGFAREVFGAEAQEYFDILKLKKGPIEKSKWVHLDNKILI